MLIKAQANKRIALKSLRKSTDEYNIYDPNLKIETEGGDCNVSSESVSDNNDYSPRRVRPCC